MYQLYRILNSKSSSSYIGMTSRGLHRRMKEHRWAAINDKKTPLYDAMRAYGVDNFSIVLVEEFDTRQECMQAEIDLIAKEDKLYNLAAGGDGGFVVSDVEAWKQKLREARRGRKPALGMKHSEENKRFFSECAKRRKTRYAGNLPSTFKEASKLLGISKTHYYRLVKRAKTNDLS